MPEGSDSPFDIAGLVANAKTVEEGKRPSDSGGRKKRAKTIWEMPVGGFIAKGKSAVI